MRKLIASLTLAYPLVIYGFRESPYFHPIALSLGGILILALIARLAFRLRMAMISGILMLLLLMQVFRLPNEVRLYPFLMSLSMWMMFALNKEPSENPMIGPFRSRLAGKPETIRAMYEAKNIWVVGLGVNTLALGVFLFAFSQEVWIVYASFYSYLLLAGLFVVSVAYVHFRRRIYHE